MSPNYPYNSSVDKWFDWYIYSCKGGMAAYTVTISADIPESCPLRLYPDDQPPYELVNTTVYNHILYFKTTNLTLLFNGSECPDAFYTGYTIQIDAEYIARTTTVPYSYTLVIVLSCVGFVIVCILVGVIAIYRIRSRQSRYDKLYKLLKEFNMKPEEIAEMKAKTDVFLIKPGKIHINFDTPLGKGVSSTVYKGRLIGPSSLHEQQNSTKTQQFVDCDVAIKVTNNFGQKEADQLFKEIDAMKKIGFHENLMCMLGWTLSGEIPCLVFEIAQKDLLHYVSAFRDLAAEMVPYQAFLSILWQITKGMHYIALKGLVHCDLAARNVLLFNNNIAKISDFGLCIDLDEALMFSSSIGRKLPIKWLALEILLDREFSEKSDVWSFGVLMYEMFTFGKIPYATANNDELVMFLQSGGRLERPSNMDDVCYEIMMSCWIKDVENRPSFAELEEKFH
uniref:receptor protein-tyrosine kinase n=1 Tax=Acrobeloides nanus TaxID=290746 RepID=A0A914CQ12_9BILA